MSSIINKSIGGRKTNLLSERNKLLKFHNDGEIEGKEVAEGLCEPTMPPALQQV